MHRVLIGPLSIAALLSGCVSLAPPSNEISIKRDTYGVPHIYAQDMKGLFYGFGYALAEDRLYQLEMARRSGNGSVAEVLGPDYVATDVATRSSLDPASIRAQLATLGPDDRAMLEGYAAGISARVREVLADREKLLPREFIDNSFEPTMWTVDDAAMVWIGLILNRFFAGTTDVANLALLHQLKTARGEQIGQQIYDQLRWIEDPTAPTIIPRESTPPVTLQQTALSHLALAPLSEAAADDFKSRQVTRMGLAAAQNMPTASNAWVLGPDKTSEGVPILYNGPQQGFNNPAFVYGIGLHGAGFDVTGLTPIGLVPVLFGTNGVIAWGSTVGSLDTNDVYQLELNPDNHHEYRFNGSYRPMRRRTDCIKIKAAADHCVEIYSTEHGPVQTWDLPNARAYAVRTSWKGREIETMLGWAHAARAKDWDAFLTQGSRVSASITWFYADVSGNIGAVGLGSLPRRPTTQDIRFPARGDGSMEWQGLLPFSANPRAYNPAQGYLASWNNQITAGLRADGANFSHVDRVNEIHAQIQARQRLNANEIWKVDENAALADLNARYFVPIIVRAASHLPPSDPVRQAADLLAGWDMKNRARRDAAVYDNPATTVLRAWLTHMNRLVLADDLPPSVLASYAELGYPTLTPRGSPGSTQPAAVSKILWNALQGSASGVPQRYDFCNGQDPQAMVLTALSSAVSELGAKFGNDMANWTTPLVPHRFSSINAIGVPWAGADQQPEIAQYLNRGTASYRVILRPGAVEMCSATAPGQSGFIDPSGVRSPHYADQLNLFRDLQCKPDRLTPAQVDANLESTRTLRY